MHISNCKAAVIPVRSKAARILMILRWPLDHQTMHAPKYAWWSTPLDHHRNRSVPSSLHSSGAWSWWS